MPSQEFKVLIDGSNESWLPYLNRVEYVESLDMLNALTMDLIFTGQARDKVLKKLVPGASYSCTIGSRKVEGDIVRVLWSDSPDDRCRLQLFGLESLHRARHVRHSEVKKLKKDGVAKAVAQKAGLKIKAKATGDTEAELVFLDEEALSLLKRLAHERNYVIAGDGKGVVFNPRNDSTGEVQVDWRYQVLDARISADIQHVATEVKVTGWDYLKGKLAEFKASDGALKKITGGDSGTKLRKKGPGALVIERNHWTGATQASDVKEIATGIFQRRAEGFVTGRIRCRAVPDATTAMKVKVKDCPWPYSGPFIISGVRHVIDAGEDWQTTIEFFSDALPS